MIPVIEHRHQTYFAAGDLERHAQIAVKTLPGEDAVVVCGGERCARVKDHLRKGEELFLSTSAVAEALGYSARLSDDRNSVSLSRKPNSVPDDRLPGVGELAPDFRLPLLGGGTVSLSDLRGKRVLINSWASW